MSELIIIARTKTRKLFHYHEFLRLDDYGGKWSQATLFSLQIKTPSITIFYLMNALKLYLWNSRFWYLVFGTRPFRFSLLTASLRCFGCMGPFSLHCSIVSQAEYQKQWALNNQDYRKQVKSLHQIWSSNCSDLLTRITSSVVVARTPDGYSEQSGFEHWPGTLCSRERHFTLKVPLNNQVYKF